MKHLENEDTKYCNVCIHHFHLMVDSAYFKKVYVVHNGIDWKTSVWFYNVEYCVNKLLQLCRVWSLWTIACQACLSMGFSKKEYWSELPCSPAGDLLNSGIEPSSLPSPALRGESVQETAPPGKPVECRPPPEGIFFV